MNNPSIAKIKKYMKENIELFVDNRTGEVNETQMAEDAFLELANPSEFDDTPEFYFDIAIDVAIAYEKKTIK